LAAGTSSPSSPKPLINQALTRTDAARGDMVEE
jgi:hypothetical protein